MNKNKDVKILMPLYNEAETIKNTLEQWENVLENKGVDYELIIYNDGSTDNGPEILEEFSKRNSRIKVVSGENKGYSPVMHRAYAEVSYTEYIFHADSDTEISPEYFKYLWDKRNEADIISGKRIHRNQTLTRKIATFMASFIMSLFFNKGKRTLIDVGCPFKLFKCSLLKEIIPSISTRYPYPDLYIYAYCLCNGKTIKEVPVKYNNSERKSYLNAFPKLVYMEVASTFSLILYGFKLLRMKRNKNVVID